jgi:hypothetical protein
MHIGCCLAQVTERWRLKASNQLYPRYLSKLEFTANGVFGITELAEAIELVFPNRLDASGSANIAGRIGSWRKAGIMKVIVRKQWSIVALGAIAFAYEEAEAADFIIIEQSFLYCLVTIEDGFDIAVEPRWARND